MTLFVAGCESDDEEDKDHSHDEPAAGDKTKGNPVSGGASDGKGATSDQPKGDPSKPEDKGDPAKPSSGIKPVVVSLSKTGHDRLYGATHDGKGNIFAVGQLAEGVDATADFSLVLAKFKADGSLDTSFGEEGVALKNVAVGGTSREVARGVVVQSTGKIVIAGAAEHDPEAEGLAAQDTDIVLVRFEADGSLDTSFGDDGVVTLDLNSGVEGVNMMTGDPAWTAGDTQWALEVTTQDRLFVHGAARAEGDDAEGQPRKDLDWVLLRLTADGELDTSFSEDGKVTLDLSGASASARGITVLPDGGVIAAGYLSSSVLGEETQQPVLYKVDADGEFDADFATEDATTAPGVWHDFAVAPPLRAEAYGAALQGDKLVTLGYGPSPGAMTTDWVSFRFTAEGERDLEWGTEGVTYIDADGYGDNGRDLLVLSDRRILGIGGGRPAPAEAPPMGMQPPTDAMLAVLTEDGQPDESFAPGGFQLFDVGGSDFFWAGSLAPDEKSAVVVGIAGGATMNVDDDDALLAIVPLQP